MRMSIRKSDPYFGNLSVYSRHVPGSSLYMANVRRDVLAMTSSPALFHPTLFLTISMNDLWPHMTKMILQAPSVASVDPVDAPARRRLLHKDKLWTVVHFRDRMDALFKEIIGGITAPLGKVVAFFNRIEFQDRGAPHLHALLWLDEMSDIHNDLQSMEGKELVRQYADGVVCATKDVSEVEYTSSICACGAYRRRVSCNGQFACHATLQEL